jgi:hypothetical protein
MKAFKKEINWQCDQMAMKKSNITCIHRRNISRYDSGERCGPWASCYFTVYVARRLIVYHFDEILVAPNYFILCNNIQKDE